MRPAARRTLLATGDGLAAAVAVLCAGWTWSLTAGVPFSLAFMTTHSAWMAAVPVWILALSPSRIGADALDAARLPRLIAGAVAWLFAAYLVAYFTLGPSVLPRLMAVYVVWNAAWITLGIRVTSGWLLTRHSWARRVAVVGEGPAADAALFLLRDPVARDVVLVDDASAATEIVVAAQSLTPAQVDTLLRAREAGREVTLFADFYEQTLRRVPVSIVGEEWVSTRLLTGRSGHAGARLAKRVLDVTGACLLLVLAAPAALVAAVAIWAETGRPILYRQPRVGRGGRIFPITKFRTMTTDAERDGPQWSQQGDPRITRVGRWLRRTHLDEWPNLWAVLSGDLSLVGPRPERPEFLELLESQVPLYRARLAATPGVTGWAQINSDYADSIEDSRIKVEHDLYYIRHQTLWLDLVILIRTCGRLFGGRGR